MMIVGLDGYGTLIGVPCLKEGFSNSMDEIRNLIIGEVARESFASIISDDKGILKHR